MRLPILSENSKARDVVTAFGGYNHNLTIGDGEFYDMTNLTSDYYPVLSPRKQYGLFLSSEAASHAPNGLIAKDGICYIDGYDFVIRNPDGTETRVENFVTYTAANPKPKTLVSMGAYVIILPDKKYINTKDITDRGAIGFSISTLTTASNVTISLCRADGSECTVSHTGTEPPTTLTNGMYWVDTSSKPNVLKQYSSASSEWVTIPTTYCKIYWNGIGEKVDQYDGITLSWSTVPTDEELAQFTGDFTVWDKGENYVIVTGLISSEKDFSEISESLTVSMSMPDMDYVIESGNRLWGCKYGLVDGEYLNEIYASKLGDFKSWRSFAGISTDSYIASCGTDGAWTGAITYNGSPTFFKERFIHKVYGTVPSNFQVLSAEASGVEEGSSRSLQIVNDVVFYKSRNGICVYDGSLPSDISAVFGGVKYKNAVGGVLGNKYYVSMDCEDGTCPLFVFDTAKKIWTKEWTLQNATMFSKVQATCTYLDELYMLVGYTMTSSQIYTINGTGALLTAPVEWYAETGDITASYIDHKYISRIVTRLSLAVGTSVRFYISYDSTGAWEHIASFDSTSLRSFNVPIRPKRCDHFRLKIVGKGDAKIHSMSKTIEQGSDER